MFFSTHQTLKEISTVIASKKKGVYLRFGDGDVNLATGKYDMLQVNSSKLTNEMKETFALNGPTIFKSLSLHCKKLNTWEKGMFPGNQEVDYGWAINHLRQAQRVWGKPINKVYSPVALPFLATQYADDCIHFLHFLKSQKPCLLVGNKNIPQTIREVLFGENCHFVPTPIRNSYLQIEKIEKECIKFLDLIPGYKVVITCLGCAGRPLQKRLWNRYDNIYLFDFGSLMDGICGWNTRAWIEINKFNGKDFLARFENQLKDV